jgi:flavin-dependent dehydrogenase
MKVRAMKVAILGAGLTAAYLYRLLLQEGLRADIFGKDPGTVCGISPCAWGTSRDFSDLVKYAGLDASAYTLSKMDHMMVHGFRIKVDLLTFDKQRLIRDLLSGAEIRQSGFDAGSYDRVIDASGVSRALLPPIEDDIRLPCVQFRVRTDEALENRITLGGIGYAWCFPLSKGEYHIGCGCLAASPAERLRELGWVSGNGSRAEVVCGCKGDIRLASPQASMPFVETRNGCEVWGVGEAIGCVAPLAGDGIVPGMKSVNLLVASWDDPEGYTRALLREFGWMKDERSIMDRLRRGERLDLESARTLKRNSARMGIRVGVKEASALLRKFRETSNLI